MSHWRAEAAAAVRSVPKGRVASYGSIGSSISNPVSGLVIGRWLNTCPEDLPWWRVVGADGRQPIAKRDPNLAKLQRERLLEEGVGFCEDRVEACAFWVP